MIDCIVAEVLVVVGAVLWLAGAVVAQRLGGDIGACLWFGIAGGFLGGFSN